MYKSLIIIFLSVLLFSCKMPKAVENTPKINPISQLIDTSSVLSNSFSGLIIQDFETKKLLFERNADRYFTPASNTKIYTLFASLKTLGDSVPALRYVIRGDSLIFWGTGDPTFMHPDFKNNAVLDFFKANSAKKLFFSSGNFTNEYYGKGWMWDDYNSENSAELSPLPLFGNIVRVTVKDKKLDIYPPFFKDSFNLKIKDGIEIERNLNENKFSMPQSLLQKSKYKQDIPYKTSTALTQKMLADTLKKPIGLLNIPVSANAKTLYSMPLEPVYRQMMQISDNTLAEHLILLCGSTLKDSINSSFSIDYIKNTHLQDLPDAPKWVDGSGLSRYNLFTPRATLKLLEKIYPLRSQDRLFSIFPTGGVGTLGNMYKSDKPYIFAKSGSMTGVYCLSGYLITKQGKLLVFSFMNNNFTKSVSTVRKEVERVLTWVHLNN